MCYFTLQHTWEEYTDHATNETTIRLFWRNGEIGSIHSPDNGSIRNFIWLDDLTKDKRRVF